MITVKNWEPDAIEDLSHRVVRVTRRRLRRALNVEPGHEPPEVRRLGIMADHWSGYIMSVIVGNMNTAVINAPARQILRELSALLMSRVLRAELATMPKRD